MFIIILWFVPPYLMIVWWPVYFGDYLCYDDIIFSLVNVKLLISISRNFSKVFRCIILITTRKVKIPESCPARDRVGRRAIIDFLIGVVTRTLCSEVHSHPIPCYVERAKVYLSFFGSEGRDKSQSFINRYLYITTNEFVYIRYLSHQVFSKSLICNMHHIWHMIGKGWGWQYVPKMPLRDILT